MNIKKNKKSYCVTHSKMILYNCVTHSKGGNIMFENDLLMALPNYKVSTKRLLLEESRYNRRYNRKHKNIQQEQ